MGAEIKTETVSCDGKSVLLISVKGGEAAIGTCNAGYIGMGGASALTRLFFIGTDPIISVVCPNHANKQSDKMVSFCPGFQGYEQKIHQAIGNGFSKLNSGEPLGSALKDILGLLQDGVYTAYFSDYYPTDGNGVFFWGGYNILHDVHGTAEQSRLVGSKTYKPCFLIPSQPLDYYAAKVKVSADEAVKRRPVQGIVYHLSGFHSVLLKGHHGAVSCVDRDVPFRCAVIEKIAEPYTDKFIPASMPMPSPIPEQTEAENDAGAEAATEIVEEINAPVFVPEGITGFRSPSVKIPLNEFPKDMLKQIIEGRAEYKPRQFSTLIAKLNSARRKALSNNVLPYTILEKSDMMPDCEMVESAFAIDSLSDEQLNCLLAGDVECNGEVIVSPNFYSSIVTACNYLQFTDMKRFVDFTIAIMDNPDLSATHDYVSRRALTQSSNKKLYRFFSDVLASGETKYDKIFSVAQTFIDRYKEQA